VLYLVIQIWLWIVLAALIGFAIGWVLRWRFIAERVNKLEDDVIMLRAARDRLEQDNKRLSSRAAAGKAASGRAGPSGREPSAGEEAEATEARRGEFDRVPVSGGIRPSALPGARAGEADDLKRINGIGPKLEEVLNQLGIYHYDQIGQWTPQNVEWMDGYLRFRGRIEREAWVDQAKRLARGEATPFSKEYDQQADGRAPGLRRG
jgi:NADH-quinone oxidoreductase subunit E